MRMLTDVLDDANREIERLAAALALETQRRVEAEQARDDFREEANALRRNYLRETADLAARVDAADQARAEAEQQLARWKNAVIDAAVVNWTYRKSHEDDPRAAINALLCQAQLEALDPSISEDAAKLHARIHELEQRLAEATR